MTRFIFLAIAWHKTCHNLTENALKSSLFEHFRNFSRHEKSP